MLTNAKSEDSVHDWFADLISGRFLTYYAVPKVTFTTYFVSHIAFLVFFTRLVVQEFRQVETPAVGYFEVGFWVWCVR